jgi:hypothetical protein
MLGRTRINIDATQNVSNEVPSMWLLIRSQVLNSNHFVRKQVLPSVKRSVQYVEPASPWTLDEWMASLERVPTGSWFLRASRRRYHTPLDFLFTDPGS